MKKLALAVACAVCATAAFAQSEDSLAELARKERERRQKTAAPAKVITERDLPRATAPAVPDDGPAADGSASAASTTTPGPEAAATPSAEDERERQRTDIQRRIDDELAVIAAVEKAMADSERELGSLDNFRFGTRRELLMKSMEDGRAQIARSQQVIDDLETEARRAGVRVTRTPPSER